MLHSSCPAPEAPGAHQLAPARSASPHGATSAPGPAAPTPRGPRTPVPPAAPPPLPARADATFARPPACRGALTRIFADATGASMDESLGTQIATSAVPGSSFNRGALGGCWRGWMVARRWMMLTRHPGMLTNLGQLPPPPHHG